MPHLTDSDMLRVARRRLADHLATRPATSTEAAAIAAGARAEESSLLAAADKLRNLPYPPAEHRPDWRERQRAAAIDNAMACQDAGRLEQRALQARMVAESWERIADRPYVAWEATRAELEGRVAYYARLVAGEVRR